MRTWTTTGGPQAPAPRRSTWARSARGAGGTRDRTCPSGHRPSVAGWGEEEEEEGAEEEDEEGALPPRNPSSW